MWWLKTFPRRDAPQICYALFHLPHSLYIPCDCKYLCKWPPRGHPDALPIVNDEFEADFEKKQEAALCLKTNHG